MSRCDGGFACQATVHVEGCYTGDGHPDAQPSDNTCPQCGGASYARQWCNRCNWFLGVIRADITDAGPPRR